MTRTVVVGGGPAGLAAAYRVSAEAGRETVVLERAPALGGLAAGFSHGEYTLDFGPHRLHVATDSFVLADLRQMLGDELELRRRRGLIRIGSRFVEYPVGPRTLLQLGPRLLARLAAGLVLARARSAGLALTRDRSEGPNAARGRRGRAEPQTYEAAVTARLGKPLYDLFYGPYAEKVWGLPGSEIAAEQAERRVNQRGVLDLARVALGRGAGRMFWYPRGGFGRIPEAYAAALAARANVRITCGASVERITWRGSRVESIDAADSVPANHLVWSAPLPELVRRLDPPPPTDVLEAASGLRYRAVVLLYLMLDLARVGSADTYYFPQRDVPFNRVIEQKNFSTCMAPADQTVLGLDISCDPDDDVFGMSDADLAARVCPALQAAGLLPAPVLEVFSRRFRSAYPIYDVAAAARLAHVQRWLDGFENLWLIGRQGLYLHNNTHHSLLMGYRAADAILSGERFGWQAQVREFASFRVAD